MRRRPGLRPMFGGRLRPGAALLWRASWCVAMAFWTANSSLGQGLGFSAPSQSYYRSVEELYRGEYREAQRDFLQELRGAVKTVSTRWIDSICYHAMLGETYYQMGRLWDALEQFDAAANLYLQYPKWMLRVNFTQTPRPEPSRARVIVPWGASQRGAVLGDMSHSMQIAQGTLNNQRVAQEGGVLQQAQYWTIDVVEVNRCISLTLRRRNELLGSLGKHDPLSQRLLRELVRGGA
ncbi:MAG: tetratricopeptide repeat protein, partial [Planctomycetales bacterium]|nr:tetratricopeptide repeat protein [Planctomycetales bacterium]